MTLPKGYTLDPPATPTHIPAGYVLDGSNDISRPAGLPDGVTLGQPGAAPAPTALRGAPAQAGKGLLGSALDSSGLSSIGGAILHLENSIKSIPGAIAGAYHNTVDNAAQGLKDYGTSGLSDTTRRDFGRAVPIVGPVLAKAQEQHDAGNDAGMAGTLGGFVGGAVLPSLLKKVPGILTATGDAAQDAGAGILNKTAGMLKPDFKRGANGGRAYLDAGGGPAMSMQGLADQAAMLKGSVGKKLGSVRNNATNAGVLASPQDVAAALSPSIQKGIDLETGPGGLGNTGSIENYSASFRPALKTAVANGGINPNDLADLKGRIADNTNWSDPSQFNLKSIRQQNVGALSGLENKIVPETTPLKQQFQGLGKFATRTSDRAETGSSPLTSIAAKAMLGGAGALAGYAEHNPLTALGAGLAGTALTSVPVQSALASGLYYGGRGIGTAGKLAMPLSDLPGLAVTPYNLLANKQKKEDANSK